MAKDKTSHPGVVLHRHFMKPHSLSINALARKIKVPPNRISAIVNGERSVSVDTALRLSRYFETTPTFWLHMQTRYDLENMDANAMRKIEKEVSKNVKEQTPPFRAA